MSLFNPFYLQFDTNIQQNLRAASKNLLSIRQMRTDVFAALSNLAKRVDYLGGNNTYFRTAHLESLRQLKAEFSKTSETLFSQQGQLLGAFKLKQERTRAHLSFAIKQVLFFYSSVLY